MRYLPKNTLAYFDSLPYVQRVNCSQRPTREVGALTKAYRESVKDSSDSVPVLMNVMSAAARFYTLNHLASILRKNFTKSEPLPDWAVEIMNTYSSCLMDQSERLLHYILCIIAREARHCQAFDSGSQLHKALTELGGEKLTSFVEILRHHGEGGAVEHYMNNELDLPIGTYLEGIETAYKLGSWSGGYGGTPWANITTTAKRFFKGEISLEMLVDVGYTLAHNGGPMFNKGMLYANPVGYFIPLLDIQRSGQMPEAVWQAFNAGPEVHHWITNDIWDNENPHWFEGKEHYADCLMYISQLRKVFPGCIGEEVDYAKVQETSVKPQNWITHVEEQNNKKAKSGAGEGPPKILYITPQEFVKTGTRAECEANPPVVVIPEFDIADALKEEPVGAAL